MKKLLNVFYVLSPDTYLALDGENLVIRKDEKIAARVPLLNLENIVCFGYQGASPALMGACAARNIGLCFLTPNGKFLARVNGEVTGNVLLRKKQYRVSEDESESVKIARNILLGKVTNSRKVLERVIRDHKLVVNVEKIKKNIALIRESVAQIQKAESIAELMGIEGATARTYFSVFDEMILRQKDTFSFESRNRRPPLDNVNAMLSFFYAILTNETASALESVGLDPYVGFLHQDRPGRPSLALDIIEELRPIFVDRFVISLINRMQVNSDGFVQRENGGIMIKDETKKIIISAWQDRKQEVILHPFLKERIQFGLIPYVQSLLLARHLRGNLDEYPPFFWN
jgi:CRISPR-associated protein Cas1